jgi:hypothetical protein
MLELDIAPVVGTPGRLLTAVTIEDVNAVASVVISLAMLFASELVPDIVACTLTDPALKTTFTCLASTPLIFEAMVVATRCLISPLFCSLKAVNSKP